MTDYQQRNGNNRLDEYPDNPVANAGRNVIGLHEAVAGQSVLAGLLNASGAKSSYEKYRNRPAKKDYPDSGPVLNDHPAEVDYWPCGGENGCVGLCAGDDSAALDVMTRHHRSSGHDRPDINNGMPGERRKTKRLLGPFNSELTAVHGRGTGTE